MRTLLFFLCLTILQTSTAQHYFTDEKADPLFDQPFTLRTASEHVEFLNEHGPDNTLVLNRISDSVMNNCRIVKAVFYCDIPEFYCKYDNHDEAIDLRYGLEKNGKLTLQPMCTSISKLSNNEYICADWDRIWISNIDGAVIRAPKCVDEIDHLYAVQKDDKFGVVNSKTKTIVDFEYDWIGQRMDGKFEYVDMGMEIWEKLQGYTVKKEGKAGIIDDRGRVQLDFKYDDIMEYFDENGAFVKQNSNWGRINFQDSVLLPFEYDSIIHSYYYLALKKDGKWGFLARDGNPAEVSFKYDDVKNPGLRNIEFIVKQGKYWGFLDDDLNEMNGFEFKEVIVLNDPDWNNIPLIACRKKSKWGIYAAMDYLSGLQTDFIYDEIIYGEYRRGQKRTKNGGLMVDFPMYRAVIKKGNQADTLDYKDFRLY